MLEERCIGGDGSRGEIKVGGVTAGGDVERGGDATGETRARFVLPVTMVMVIGHFCVTVRSLEWRG
jgi:hypothetical protein